MRCQALGASSGTLPCSINLYDGAFTQSDGYSGVDTIGFVSGSTSGTTLTTSFTPLIASTAKDYCGFLGCIDAGGVSGGFSLGSIDIAVGGSGSEQIIIPGLSCYNNGTNQVIGCAEIPFRPIAVPVGSRLSAKFTTQFGNPCNLTLYGVYQ